MFCTICNISAWPHKLCQTLFMLILCVSRFSMTVMHVQGCTEIFPLNLIMHQSVAYLAPHWVSSHAGNDFVEKLSSKKSNGIYMIYRFLSDVYLPLNAWAKYSSYRSFFIHHRHLHIYEYLSCAGSLVKLLRSIYNGSLVK